jgi:hypothetical protein
MLSGETYTHVDSSTYTGFKYVGTYAPIYLLTVAKLIKAVHETWIEDVNISTVVITILLYNTF